ncbi:GNAT family N-acetyltransferase [Chromobacterium subtsugae]|uniref:GNAT family N-acetyltransferase n=1 Tax=Chromobacterium subtsugae TaxID=251747 RepID=A0ABS7FIK9_9NEIS|nr:MULTISPECIES: GNAT family N-acetyltransferase [Chromobacterium]KUM02263.1 GNAT family acetyltransferase [Chromobacterium subtsugae]KZE86218.1 GNAT family acetyltransferase [Chromobacterium sp. F49]MBW7568065.1 GNAT family N-acetyltransferase [Chromobacterium subtsugae]MBW8289561.1 GNAT family N-acetyltransferase [Chromobacterium subtsugae]OBU86250.1 GNAT family acetyltransferase [Chromobacterium subtsugae]
MAWEVDTCPERLDRDMIHRYLAQESYWARSLPREVLERSLAHSLCFGVYAADGAQIGFARVVTDRATFAYLADVFVLDAWRGRGVGKQLVGAALAHPDLQGLRRMMLATADAHGLYAQYGFAALSRPERLMEKLDQDVYLRKAAGGDAQAVLE